MSTPKLGHLELAESLVAYGKKQGATEVEVTIREGRKRSVSVLEGNVESLTDADHRTASMRVFVDGKAASAASSDLAPVSLQRLLDSAVARARSSGADPLAGLPQLEKTVIRTEALKLYDPAVTSLATDKMIADARQLETVGLAQGRVKKSTGSFCTASESRRTLVNSKGFTGSFAKTLVSCGVGFQAGEGETLVQDDWTESRTALKELPPLESVARRAVERVARLIGPRKVQTQKVPVILEAPVTARLVLGFLAQCVDGAAVARRQSFLLGMLRQRVGSELVTVTDDGLVPGAVGTEPFDAEGAPARATTVLDKGVLRHYLLDTYFARKLKLAGTGSASGPTNLVLSPGMVTEEAMIRSVDQGLLLVGTMGHGTVPTTGDISVGAVGLWISRGEIAFPVAEITVSSNLGDLLKGIVMVGNNLELNRRLVAPTVKVAEMTVGGKGASS